MPNDASGHLRRYRILLVEDHADTAVVMARLLQRAGYDTVSANSMEEALRAVEREMSGEGLDLVVSDIGLSDGSGLDLMRELSVKHQLPGIALSGFGMDSDLQRSREAGFQRHLIKPVNPMVLRQTVQEILAHEQARRAGSGS